jgi:hypothetical protein
MDDTTELPVAGAGPATPVTLVVDVANVMGSRPDGWWKDRAGAAARLLAPMPALVGRAVVGPEGESLALERIVAVVEGQAKAIAAPEGIEVVHAPADGDSAIAATALESDAAGERVLVVTADRGLRARLPDGALVAGPGWLNALLGR